MSKTHLRCRECKKEYEPTFKYVCDECFGPLDVHYDYPTLTKDSFTNKLLTIVGSPYSLNELINNVGKILNKKPKVHHISMTVLKPMVKIYQSFSKKPVVTKEQLVNLNSGSHSMSYDSSFPISSLNESVRLTLSDSDNL